MYEIDENQLRMDSEKANSYLKSISFMNNYLLKPEGTQCEWTDVMFDEYENCMDDYMYFIERYMKIVSVDKGIIPFKPYDYQRKMIKNFYENRFSINLCPRQCGKTTISTGFLLHFLMFNENKSIAVLANKQATAVEILDRIKLAYENLPKWMQHGIRTWNKTEIVLENGCKILAASSSSSSIRGMSLSILYIDECAFINNNIWEEFYMSVYPVISSGKETRIIMVSTPRGLNHYYKLWRDAEAKRNSYVPFKITWRDVPGRDENWKDETIRNNGERAFMQEHEVNFLGSSNTLFDMNKIQEIVPQNPIIDDVDNYTKIYEEPIENHTYIGFVDVSEGKEQDSSVIQIFDITQEPYKQVAVFCSNTISLMLFPFYINQLGKKYNDAYLLVENNSIGTSVTNDLFNDFEYENILYSFKEDGKIYIDDGQDDKGEMGIKMTKSSKKIGCNNIKEIFENGKLLINDMDTISQMSTFIRLGTSYAADPSAKAHDDLITPLIHMGFLIKQRWFKDLLKEDVRANIAGIKIKNEKMFLGFKQRGSETENLTPIEDDPFANWDNISSNNYTKSFNKNNYPNLFLKR